MSFSPNYHSTLSGANVYHMTVDHTYSRLVNTMMLSGNFKCVALHLVDIKNQRMCTCTSLYSAITLVANSKGAFK